jgi:hypothetical protein
MCGAEFVHKKIRRAEGEKVGAASREESHGRDDGAPRRLVERTKKIF